MKLSNFQIIQFKVVSVGENDSLDYNESSEVGKNLSDYEMNFKEETTG